MSKNILTELRSAYPYLSPVEKRITDILLHDPQKFIGLSTAQLSEKANVSQGSINNFSRKFSDGGFSALKLRIAGCLTDEEKNEPFSVIDPARTVKAAMAQKIKANAAAFYHTLEINDEQQLQKAVDLILGAKRIQAYGVYYSGVSANDFCFHLLQLGIPAAFVSDMLMCAVSAYMLDENGLMFAISSSGRTKEVIESVNIGKEKGASVICLTSDRFSPLAAMSDVVLLTSSGKMSVTDSSDEIRLSQLLVLDTLCAFIRGRVEAGNDRNYYMLKQIINSHSILD